MNRRLPALLLLLLALVSLPGYSQSPQTPRLKQALARATSDTSRALLLADLSASYRYSRFDSVLWYARQGVQLAQRIDYPKGEGRCLSRIGILMGERGNLPQALRIDLKALQLNEKSQDLEGTARTLNQTGLLYYALDDFRPALNYFFRSKKIYEMDERIGDDSQLISVLTNIGASYEGRKQLDSAQYFLNRAYGLAIRSHTTNQSPWGNPLPYVLRELGLLQASLGRDQQALRYYRLGAKAAVPENDLRSRCRSYQYMAELYRERHQTDSSVYYARKALAVGQALPFVVGIVRTSSLLANAFQARGQHDSTLKYMNIMLVAQDSLYNPQRIKQLDAIGFAEQQRLRQLEQEREQFISQVRTYALLAGVGGLLLIALLLWYNNQQQQRANIKLQALNEQVTQQKEELRDQRDNLARTLQELKATQSQLVLREKMASLGELMAGVAHEIQNPVTCVKNFAGISAGLCQELREEMARLPFSIEDQDLIDDLLQNLSQYQAKIVQNGQRADSIVRDMLEYSSAGPSPRQPTDLNALADDYLRLTYHDLRAKNRNFNVALLPQLDPAVGLVSLARHDIGRVLVSLFTNALYAVQQRQRLAEEDYVPQVSVSTRRVNDHVEIRVRDNGMGIPESARDSIFQRFFTTKPTGEGTGLSLSLSHDIVTKGHGGTITVESQEGEYTEFMLTLPLQPKLSIPRVLAY
ncbi:tetratricopeptide repeat-containing sensor histidine kinase [Hymenobacter jejuensis]|uniref:histidine kinase n=1 Tax=Hymenobacter jejuensis TaxID=2502781 RepID=A0A5B7ZV78_9BACT|nr:ATP-binding protein [Hymenobacter jejuensis]QDA59114.1 tetratricopeptide repeat protein [Hymenobacter jejuensis]